MTSLLSVLDVNHKKMMKLFHLTDKIKKDPSRYMLKDKCISTVFLEPSTRTKLSFVRAMQLLNGDVLDFNPEESSLKKGEDIYDTIKTICKYKIDAIIFRSPISYSAKEIAEYSHPIPVINAGDGTNEHPTQALLDLYTIYKTFKRLKGISIALIGDLLNHRTAHSLFLALSNFDVKLFLVSPPKLTMPKKYFDIANDKFALETADLEVIHKVDVVYILPFIPSKKNFYKKIGINKIPVKEYILTQNKLKDNNVIILHPFPRHGEITKDIDKLPNAKYFEQIKNGLYIRMALLYLFLR